MTLADRFARVQTWSETPAAKILGRVCRALFFVGVLAWLVLKVRAIGWSNVAAALPRTPWFYLLFVVMFMALPLSEVLIFRLLLGRKLPGALPVFVRKRVFNSAFVGYSGELYLFVWVRQRLGIASKTLLLAIKDNAILSALASAGITSVLLLIFMATGRAKWIADWLHSAGGMVLAALLVAGFLTPLLLRLRRQILSVPWATAGTVFAIHVARIAVVVLLQATQWAVVLPTEPWSVWVTFLTVQMVISRLPVVPNRDLLFLSAALEMSHIVDGPRAAMAGLLLAGGALTQGSNLLFFLLTSFERRRSGSPAPIADEPAIEAVIATPGAPPANE
ncbi:hypothetical protein [Sphingomonas sp. Leaf25]|uniref:hypothetical protein n=1 Tax=Sphingomonas sp. Leaf25 TaxID=1735692 RepID=UPI0006F8F32E|nr:hypothetical protein [Sphingomonas sp. Leaf25]KQM98795.1 hypothetical protein ASE78_06100 [Sphingomonas sp. Leaf25]